MGKLDNLNYVDLAEATIKSIGIRDHRDSSKFIIRLTTSKIRNILSLVSELYISVNQNVGDVLSEDIRSRFLYLKMRLAYEAGRDNEVRAFVDKANLFEFIENIGSDKSKAIVFCRYMEALVAYHRFYGGRDK